MTVLTESSEQPAWLRDACSSEGFGTKSEEGIVSLVFFSTLDTAKAKKRLEGGLTGSTLATTFVDMIDIVPSSTLWFVPTNFRSALDVLDYQQSLGGG